MKRYIPLLILILPGLVVAADKKPQVNGWKGEGELGFTSTSGNTESESLNAKLGVAQFFNKWTNKAGIELLKASTDGVESSESLIFTARTEHKFTEKAYTFAALRYENDKFIGFDYQSSISFGIGDQVIKNETQVLDLSAGLGYRELKETLTENVSSDAIVTGNLNYQYTISKHATLKEKILVESGDSNTHSESETSLTMKVSGNLGSKIAYTVKHNSDVPAGVDNYNRITSITLVYNF